MIRKIIFCLLLVISLSACATLSGKKEISDADINAQAAKSYAEVKSKSKISTNPVWTEMVQRVAARIARASGENFQWEWVLIESPEVNAWCMPGGKIAVYTGIMPVLKNEAALAAVLGHEVAHAVRRHGKQRYARAMTENEIGLLVGGAAVIGGQLSRSLSSIENFLAATNLKPISLARNIWRALDMNRARLLGYGSA